MVYTNILQVNNRKDFRKWLSENHQTAKECFVELKRGKPVDDLHFWYIDAIEEALCFGWIDSTVRVIDDKRMQRFSPRRKGSNWTELNKERVRRLEKMGLMTDAGRMALPNLDLDLQIDEEIKDILIEEGAWEGFLALPPLYQRIRMSNLMFYKKRDPEAYMRMLQHTIDTSKRGETFGEWNDYGRLLDY